jgi:hypothetical protein
LFFIEAGIAEIGLARDAECEGLIQASRTRFLLSDPCLPEWSVYLFGGASRGVVGVMRPEVSLIFAWLVMAVLYAVIGAGCSLLTLRWGLIVFAGIHISLLAALTALGYLAQFVA